MGALLTGFSKKMEMSLSEFEFSLLAKSQLSGIEILEECTKTPYLFFPYSGSCFSLLSLLDGTATDINDINDIIAKRNVKIIKMKNKKVEFVIK